MSKTFLNFLTLAVFGAVFFFIPAWSQAQLQPDDLGIQFGEETDLSDEDPRTIAARIIRVTLGLLGTITLVLIVYGGFLWMTAAGNDDQVAKAKKIMGAGIIGLAIVLSAFAISTFVINQLLEATTGP